MDREIIKDGTGNYLKLPGSDSESYSDRIFSYQEIQGFLPLEVRWINGNKEYIYDISGKLSLAEFLNKGDFSLDDIRLLFGQIFDMADVLEEYLLDSRGVMVQEEFLYLDPAAGRWQGIYLEDRRQELADSVGHLLEFIMDKMNQKDRELVLFVYEMHKLTRGAGCTRGMMREYVSDYKDREQKENAPLQVPLKKEVLPEYRKRPKESIAKRSCLLPGMILTAGLAIPVALWWLGMYRLPISGGTDWLKAGGTAAFFLAVSGYGVWKTMPERDRKKEEIVMFHSEDRQQKKVCLIPQTGAGVPVPIPCFPYRLEIRHSEEQTPDCLLIDQEAGVVTAVDEESSQGILHNNRRLVPWKKMPLQDGDFLCFDKKEYVVEITQSEYVM